MMKSNIWALAVAPGDGEMTLFISSGDGGEDIKMTGKASLIYPIVSSLMVAVSTEAAIETNKQEYVK